MKIDNTVLIILVTIAIIIVALLAWKNLRDEKNIDPELTDELEKEAAKNHRKDEL